MNNIINIGIDLDGIFSNFCKAFSEICNKLYGDRCYIIYEEHKEKIKHWNWENWYPITKEEIKNAWNHLKNIENFWENNIELMNLDAFLKLILKINSKPDKYNLYFITSREQTKGKTLVSQSVEWLKKAGITNPQVIISHEKEYIVKYLDIKYFVDDKGETIENVKNMNSDCNVYVLDYPYNRFVTRTDVKRIYELTDFIKDIEINNLETIEKVI